MSKRSRSLGTPSGVPQRPFQGRQRGDPARRAGDAAQRAADFEIEVKDPRDHRRLEDAFEPFDQIRYGAPIYVKVNSDGQSIDLHHDDQYMQFKERKLRTAFGSMMDRYQLERLIRDHRNPFLSYNVQELEQEIRKLARGQESALRQQFMIGTYLSDVLPELKGQRSRSLEELFHRLSHPGVQDKVRQLPLSDVFEAVPARRNRFVRHY